LSWSGIYSLLALLRAGKWSAFMHEWRATAREDGQGLGRALAANVLMPGAPPAVRRLIRRVRGLDPDSAARYSALNPAFIAELKLAKQWRAQGFDPWFRLGDWNAPRYRAHFMFDYNQLARDTRSMSDEHHGFGVRDPHADRRLLEFLLAVPEPMFRRDGIQRAFARRVLADRLPREILDERRTGAHIPTWFRRLDAKRKDIATDIERLEASPLAARLIDLPRLKRLMAEWPRDEHAAELQREEYALALARGVHVGRFIRWVEGGNA
jgi:asparagine synthase (glutamine-hydrolysing)